MRRLLSWKNRPENGPDPSDAKAQATAPPGEAADVQTLTTYDRNAADETEALRSGFPDESEDGGQSAPVRHKQHVGRHAAGGRDSMDNTAAQGDANRAEGRDDQERPTVQGEPIDEQDMTAILRSVQESVQPAQVIVYEYLVPSAPPLPKEREVVAMPPTPPRPEEQGSAETLTAPPLPKEREVVAMPPTPGPPLEEEPTDRAAARFPAPAILVGRPRLGSAPGRPPRAKRSPADSVLDGAQVAGFTVRAASLRGDDHRYNCDPRQDSIGLWALNRPSWLNSGEDLLLVCVADGVGNCPLSHLGSAEACWLLRQHVEAHIAALTSAQETEVQRGCQRVIDEVAAGLRVLADSHGLGAKEVSTTLTAGLVVPAKKRSEAAADALVFRVGDSPGFLLRKSEWKSIASKSGDEEDVYSTGTDALPTRPETCQVETRRLLAGDMLMLCSDGLSGPMDRNENVRDQLAEWWGGHPPSLPEFYWQMSFRAQTYGDDRSAVCVWAGV
jgi:serine/threonine protein phosphatase PrpC